VDREDGGDGGRRVDELAAVDPLELLIDDQFDAVVTGLHGDGSGSGEGEGIQGSG